MSKQSEKVKRWRKRVKQKIIEVMGGSCACCGYNKCQSSLALHHINPKEKNFSFNKIRANPKSWQKLVIELRKCIMVCHNCHCEIHEGIRKIPQNINRFNEKYTDYYDLELKIKIEKPNEYHPCPHCNNPTPNFKKYCSNRCTARSKK
jgi:hypothetical protein